MVQPRPVTELADDLRQLGVASGDTLMVHASLRAIGPVEGGAAGVLRALELATAPNGTILMVLGAKDDWAWVNDRPEDERAALLVDAPPFDCDTTPAEPEVGTLAEVMRRTDGTLVSDHPEGRFGARGMLAAHLVTDVPWDDYYGPGSPLERLVQVRGKVLRLGADRNTVTVLHYAEYLAAVHDKRRVRRHRRVLGAHGPEIRIVSCLDDNAGIVDYPGEDYFSVILDAYVDECAPPRGTVGKAHSELLDARDLVAFGSNWMTDHFGPRR